MNLYEYFTFQTIWQLKLIHYFSFFSEIRNWHLKGVDFESLFFGLFLHIRMMEQNLFSHVIQNGSSKLIYFIK